MAVRRGGGSINKEDSRRAVLAPGTRVVGAGQEVSREEVVLLVSMRQGLDAIGKVTVRLVRRGRSDRQSPASVAISE